MLEYLRYCKMAQNWISFSAFSKLILTMEACADSMLIFVFVAVVVSVLLRYCAEK